MLHRYVELLLRLIKFTICGVCCGITDFNTIPSPELITKLEFAQANVKSHSECTIARCTMVAVNRNCTECAFVPEYIIP